MSLKRLAISRKFGGRRYAVLTDRTFGHLYAAGLAEQVRQQGYSVRVVLSKTGWAVYHYPQYPRPKGWD